MTAEDDAENRLRRRLYSTPPDSSITILYLHEGMLPKDLTDKDAVAIVNKYFFYT